MSFTDLKRREIKNYLLRKIDEDVPALTSKVADAFGISATSVKRYLEFFQFSLYTKHEVTRMEGIP